MYILVRESVGIAMPREEYPKTFKVWSVILEEIDKCVVRCLYCHRKRTATQFGWWKVNSGVV